MKLATTEALFRGVAAGFSSPYRIAYGRRSRLVYEPRDFVSLAWENVGTALRSSIETERNSLGKAAQSHKPNHC